MGFVSLSVLGVKVLENLCRVWTLCSPYNSHHSLPTLHDSPSITLTDNSSASNTAYTASWRMQLWRARLKCVSIYEVVLDCVHLRSSVCVHLGRSILVYIKHNCWVR